MIRIDHCSITFGRGTPNEVRALDDLTFEIGRREFVVMIGTNGSGKSTLLNTIAGSLRPEAGRIFIDDEDVTALPEHRRARYIGRVFQNPFSGTAPTMTIAENLRLASLRGEPKRLSIGLRSRAMAELRERCAELGMGLENRLDTPIGLLSGGERQALTLLMATLREPRILLLDEHTAALDPRSAEAVITLTDAIVARHALTVLMVTHDMEEAARFGSRLVMMHGGRIALDITGDEKSRLTATEVLSRFGEARGR
jgi:putative ABC transport system ATP-binding protein